MRALYSRLAVLLPPERARHLCTAIEEHVALFSSNNQAAYTQKCMQLLYNLEVNGKNIVELIDTVLGDRSSHHESVAATLVALDNQWLAHGTPVATYKQSLLQKRDNCARVISMLTADTDEDRVHNENALMVCYKCKGNDIDFELAQTRSADEPMTVFCTCLNPKCGCRWTKK